MGAMQLSKIQISAVLADLASQQNGFNETLRLSFEAIMKPERWTGTSRMPSQ